MNPAVKKPIRFGIMCHGLSFPAFEAVCIRKLMEIDEVEPALLIKERTICSTPPLSVSGIGRFASIVRCRKDLIYRIIKKIDTRIHKPLGWDRVSLFHELGHLPVIECEVDLQGAYSQYFHEDDTQNIRNYELDFILRFGFNIIRGKILESARYGVWSFHHDDEQKYRGGPVGVWEIYHNDPINGAILQRLTDRLDGGVVLKKGYFKTIDYSLNLNYDNVLFGAAEWPANVCRDIILGKADYVFNRPIRTRAPIFRSPNNRQAFLLSMKMLKNYVSNSLYAKFSRDKWTIAIGKADRNELLEGRLPGNIRWMRERLSDKFYADPFPLKNGTDGLTILAEEFEYSKNRGRVVSINFDEKDGFSEPIPAIEGDTHFSYPSLIRLGRDVYCVPENSVTERVLLYKALSFPDRWQEIATLIEGKRLSDCTVFFHEGGWWLFCTPNSSADCELHVWFSRELEGPWSPHPRNPVKCDIRSARPAGNLFSVNNEIYRPSQNCSKRYGQGITINRIRKLSMVDFDEEPVASLTPLSKSCYNMGIHHLCFADEYVVFDGYRRELSLKRYSRPLSRWVSTWIRRMRRCAEGS